MNTLHSRDPGEASGVSQTSSDAHWPNRPVWLPPAVALDRFQTGLDTTNTTRRASHETVRFGFRVGSIGLLIKADVGSEVLRFTKPAQIPGAPSYLIGITNVRGTLVPVFDLTQVANLGISTGSSEFMILVLGKGDTAIGIRCNGHPVAVRDPTPLREPPPVPPALQKHVSAGCVSGEDVWVEFDHVGLVSSLIRNSGK